jgi:hypothetical protein
MKKLFFLSGLLLMQGCASTISIKPDVYESQRTVYEAGTEAIISTQNTIVAIRATEETYLSSKRPSFLVTVHNPTDTEFVFSTEDITVSLNDFDLAVLTYDQLVKEIKQQQMAAAIAVGFAAAANSYSAAQAGHQYNYGNTYSPYGYGTYPNSTNNFYSGYSYNAAAAQQAQAAAQQQNQANFALLQAETEKALNEVSNTILRKQTVMPGQWHGGVVKVEKPSLEKGINVVEISINAGEDQHKFKFLLENISAKNTSGSVSDELGEE